MCTKFPDICSHGVAGQAAVICIPCRLGWPYGCCVTPFCGRGNFLKMVYLKCFTCNPVGKVLCEKEVSWAGFVISCDAVIFFVVYFYLFSWGINGSSLGQMRLLKTKVPRSFIPFWCKTVSFCQWHRSHLWSTSGHTWEPVCVQRVLQPDGAHTWLVLSE